MRTAELVKIRRMIRGCGVLVNDSFRVMPYESHTCTGDDAGRTKLNQISGSLFLFFFVTNPTCSHKKKLNDK